MEKNKKIFLGLGLAAVGVVAYLFLKPKSIKTNDITNNNVTDDVTNNNVTTNNVADPSVPKLLIVAKQGAKLQAYPKDDSKVLATYNVNDMVYPSKKLSGFFGSWYYVYDGGWIKETNLKLAN